MKTLDAGPDGVRHPGKIYDVHEKEAIALVKGGHAEHVPDVPPVTKGEQEKATLTPPENAEGKGKETFKQRIARKKAEAEAKAAAEAEGKEKE